MCGWEMGPALTMVHAAASCCQTEAEAAAKQADIRIKHLQKQLAEQQKALASKQKEGSKLQADLDKERKAVEQCRWGGVGTHVVAVMVLHY